jgi:hypothetical protein
MRVRPLAGLAVLLALASTAFAADEVKVKFPWDFGVGSFVHTKTTTKMSVPGAPAMPEMVMENKQTLVKITDEAWIVKSEQGTGGSWMPGSEISFPRKFTGSDKTSEMKIETEDLGTEKVTVEGTAYDCKKIKAKGSFGTTTSWTNEKHGVLKSETEATGGNTSTMTVTALAKKAKAGDKDVVCREVKNVSKMSMGPVASETTMVMLTSDAVPGHTVRSEMTTSGQVSQTAVTEVIAFEAKPK